MKPTMGRGVEFYSAPHKHLHEELVTKKLLLENERQTESKAACSKCYQQFKLALRWDTPSLTSDASAPEGRQRTVFTREIPATVFCVFIQDFSTLWKNKAICNLWTVCLHGGPCRAEVRQLPTTKPSDWHIQGCKVPLNTTSWWVLLCALIINERLESSSYKKKRNPVF